jgi:ubiquinone biosynthesis protein UbiJ
MTRKLSISVPDDIAEHLDQVNNASAYITEAVRMRRKRERVRAMLERHGVHVTDEGVDTMGERLRNLEERRRRRTGGDKP